MPPPRRGTRTNTTENCSNGIPEPPPHPVVYDRWSDPFVYVPFIRRSTSKRVQHDYYAVDSEWTPEDDVVTLPPPHSAVGTFPRPPSSPSVNERLSESLLFAPSGAALRRRRHRRPIIARSSSEDCASGSSTTRPSTPRSPSTNGTSTTAARSSPPLRRPADLPPTSMSSTPPPRLSRPSSIRWPSWSKPARRRG